MIAQTPPLIPWLVWIAVLAAAGILAFIFAALEIGLYMMNKIRLDLRAESGDAAAKQLRKILSNQGNFLAVLLISVNFATYAATFAISGMFILAGCGERSEWYTLLVATPLLFVFCESIPKNLAQRSADRMTYRLAGVLHSTSLALNACGLAPLVRGYAWLMMRLLGKKSGPSPIGQQRLLAIVAEGQAAGVLTHTQTIMADRVMNIANVKLRDVMIPMQKVAWAPLELSHDQMLDLMRSHNYSRFPQRDAAGQVVAILNIYDALAAVDHAPPTGKTLEPLILPQTLTVTDALYRMQRTHSPMAVVADEAGKHVGIVTVKDLVEEIVGELGAW